MRRSIKVVLAVAVLGGLGYLTWWRIAGRSETTSNGGAQPTSTEGLEVSAGDAFSTDLPIPVEGAQVVRGDLVLEVRASGQAASPQTTVLRAQVAGLLAELPVRENVAAAAGLLLLRIDSTELALAVQEAKAQLDRANQEFRRNTLGDDRISDPQIRAERERAARITAGIDQAEVAVRRAEFNLSRTRVTAPFAGRVASIKVVVGQHVSVGDELMTIVDLDPIKVEVQVLESEVGYLSAGGGARIVFAAFPGEVFEGRIATINPLVDQTTRTARVTVMVPNPRARILPGFFADVTLEARRLPDRVMVPRRAILERDGRPMLFVFDGEGTTGVAEWRYVTPGLGNSTVVEIVDHPDTKMVESGEIVLVDGHYTLTHGARIRITENVAAEGGRPR
ncbi:MAG: efflux RND transporter periplasmic adaptor subunit [Gemmatimonadetes bacterium]|nr:efflux RND transporter periplasmic adaptor subunit [Gemmatimonadota bacterium]